jgi:hypothetical protein
LIGPAETGALPNPQFLERALAAGWLELVRERIPQLDALQIARSSDGLLLLQLQSDVHLPAKIFEYLQIGRPILAFIRRDSPAEWLLKRSGVPNRCVYPDSTPELTDDTVAGFFDLPSNAIAPSSWFEQQFNVENQTRQLDAIIRSLHQEPMLKENPSSRLLAEPGRMITNQDIRVCEKTQKI